VAEFMLDFDQVAQAAAAGTACMNLSRHWWRARLSGAVLLAALIAALSLT